MILPNAAIFLGIILLSLSFSSARLPQPQPAEGAPFFGIGMDEPIPKRFEKVLREIGMDQNAAFSSQKNYPIDQLVKCALGCFFWAGMSFHLSHLIGTACGVRSGEAQKEESGFCYSEPLPYSWFWVLSLY